MIEIFKYTEYFMLLVLILLIIIHLLFRFGGKKTILKIKLLLLL